MTSAINPAMADLRAAVGEIVEPVTSFEHQLLDWVVGWDEYAMLGRSFEPGDVVVDVGAHIGAFTALVHVLGSRAIHAFEPDVANHARLCDTASGLDGVIVHRRAVFRSDRSSGSISLPSSGSRGDNTGSVNVVFGGRGFDVEAQMLDIPTHDRFDSVGTVGLDDVLVELGRVRLLKLDCEGSEFPILLTSRRLDLVDEVVGEYHAIDDGLASSLVDAARLDGLRSYEPAMLAVTLTAAGFDVTMRPAGPMIGLFRAVRRASDADRT